MPKKVLSLPSRTIYVLSRTGHIRAYPGKSNHRESASVPFRSPPTALRPPSRSPVVRSLWSRALSALRAPPSDLRPLLFPSRSDQIRVNPTKSDPGKSASVPFRPPPSALRPLSRSPVVRSPVVSFPWSVVRSLWSRALSAHRPPSSVLWSRSPLSQLAAFRPSFATMQNRWTKLTLQPL